MTRAGVNRGIYGMWGCVGKWFEGGWKDGARATALAIPILSATCPATKLHNSLKDCSLSNWQNIVHIQ